MGIFKKSGKGGKGGSSDNPGSNGSGSYTVSCPVCGASFTETDKGRANMAMQIHKRSHMR